MLLVMLFLTWVLAMLVAYQKRSALGLLVLSVLLVVGVPMVLVLLVLI